MMHQVIIEYDTLGPLYMAIHYCYLNVDTDKWHVINEYNADRLNHETWQNILENNKGIDNIMKLFGVSLMVYPSTFYFENKDDALKFKLAFGGEQC